MEAKNNPGIFIFRNKVWNIEKRPYGRRDYFVIARHSKNLNGEVITIRDQIPKSAVFIDSYLTAE